MFDAMAVLRKGPCCGGERQRLQELLATPWTWPHDQKLQELARRWGLEPPPCGEPAPGETLLVALQPQSMEASMYRLCERQAAGYRDCVLSIVDDALECVRMAERHARRDLPVLPHPGSESADIVGCLLHTDHSEIVPYLRGTSFGLPLCLATASRLVGVPLPSTLCATGAIDADGRVMGVDGVERKASLVARAALGVTTMLVPEENVEEARRGAALRPDLQVVGVRHLREAIALALPDLQSYSNRWWSDPCRAAEAAEAFFWLALKGSPLFVEWNAVGRACDAIAQNTKDADVVWKARVAAAIAWRHTGRPDAAIEWPDEDQLAKLRRPIRLEFLAHAVQAAADTGDEETLQKARGAATFVASKGEEHAEDLKLLGAIGRALAAVEEYAEAEAHLSRALDGWFELDSAAEASHCLCELLRVRGVLGRTDQVQALVNQFVPKVIHAMEEQGLHHAIVFPVVATVRALVQIGAFHRAFEWLRPWQAAIEGGPAHARVALARWRARALAGLGDAQEAARVRREVEERFADNENVRSDLMLVMLDRALDEGRDPAALCDEIVGSDPSFRFLHREGQTTAERARAYAERSRY